MLCISISKWGEIIYPESGINLNIFRMICAYQRIIIVYYISLGKHEGESTNFRINDKLYFLRYDVINKLG